MRDKPTLRAMKKAVGEDGLKCVFLTRVSLVIPYPVLNYGFGLTDVTWRDYILGCTGMIVPGHCMLTGAQKRLTFQWR